ncbi:MAG: potassium transporter TrkG [Cyanobacteria bacterium P01_G01_bin.39]
MGILALWLAGMGRFDAVNHSFATLSTGGFSTRTNSIGYGDSPAVEAVTIVLMIY